MNYNLNIERNGDLYIEIKDLNFTQENIEPFTCYVFSIYMFGLQKDDSIVENISVTLPVHLDFTIEDYILEGLDKLTDNFVYSDIKDCLDRAKNIIETNKETLLNFFHSISI